MNLESERQGLARRLVDREVYYCVSALVSDLSVLVQNVPYNVQRDLMLSWEDDILPLLEGTDYEAALREYIDNADVDDMENLVENDGWWNEFLSEKAFPVLGRPGKVPSICADRVCLDCHEVLSGLPLHDTPPAREVEVAEAVAEFSKDAVYCGEEHDEEFDTERCDCCDSRLAGQRFTYENPDEMDEQELSDWLDADRERDTKFRELVFKQVLETSDLQELCSKFDVDLDDHRYEVYEHWIVSDWLAARLRERGEITGDLCGLTIWGRACTGQSICLDRVVQEIAINLWQEEWDELVKGEQREPT